MCITILLCRFEDAGKGGVVVQDCDDDGESAAGGRLLHLLQVSVHFCSSAPIYVLKVHSHSPEPLKCLCKLFIQLLTAYFPYGTWLTFD